MIKGDVDRVDPHESLETIRTTLQKVRRNLFFSSGPVYTVWGLVILIGFSTTGMAETGRLGGIQPGPWLSLFWIVVTGLAGLYTALYYRRQPVETDVGLRFGLVWPAAFTVMGFTVASFTAAGLPLHGVEFGVFAVYTVAVIYLITGALLLDNVQVAVGIWLGISNIVGLRFGIESYPLVVGVMVGIGLIVAGFIEDRIHGPGRGPEEVKR